MTSLPASAADPAPEEPTNVVDVTEWLERAAESCAAPPIAYAPKHRAEGPAR